MGLGSLRLGVQAFRGLRFRVLALGVWGFGAFGFRRSCKSRTIPEYYSSVYSLLHIKIWKNILQRKAPVLGFESA